jgi:hypothetical protein
LHHAAYISQIAAGIWPPTNPSGVEMPANVYWLWHATLAAGGQVFGASAFHMSLLSNALGLAGFLCALWLAVGVQTSNRWLRLAACTVPFFILDPLGLLQFAGRLSLVWIPALFGALAAGEVGVFEHLVGIARHHGALQLGDHSLVPLFPRLGLFDGVLLSDRAGDLVNKFLNFNSFALAFFASAQLLLLSTRFSWRVRGIGIAVSTLALALISPLPVLALGLSVAAKVFVEGPRVLRDAKAEDSGLARVELAAPVLGSLAGMLVALPSMDIKCK